VRWEKDDDGSKPIKVADELPTEIPAAALGVDASDWQRVEELTRERDALRAALWDHGHHGDCDCSLTMLAGGRYDWLHGPSSERLQARRVDVHGNPIPTDLQRGDIIRVDLSTPEWQIHDDYRVVGGDGVIFDVERVIDAVETPEPMGE
jgi:hypothetical protein